MRLKAVAIATFLLIFPGFAQTTVAPDSQNTSTSEITPRIVSVLNKPIERIPMVDNQGSTVSFDDLAGEVTIVYFYASWCAPCFKKLTEVQVLKEQRELNYRFLPVALDNEHEKVKRLTEMSGYKGHFWLAKQDQKFANLDKFGNKNSLAHIVKLDQETNIVAILNYLREL